MKKFIFVFAILLGMVSSSTAQEYQSAVGLRFGYPTSVTYKHYLTETNAFEVYAGTRYSAVFVNAAYQIHNPLGEVDNLEWYYGFGGGVIFGNGFTGALVSGYLGLQYTLDDAPVTFSIDWVPSFLFGNNYSGFGGDYAGLSARYILNR
ncbi:MAG: hypothetical protein V3V14_01080 [Saprospiraceae bacterium]